MDAANDLRLCTDSCNFEHHPPSYIPRMQIVVNVRGNGLGSIPFNEGSAAVTTQTFEEVSGAVQLGRSETTLFQAFLNCLWSFLGLYCAERPIRWNLNIIYRIYSEYEPFVVCYIAS